MTQGVRDRAIPPEPALAEFRWLCPSGPVIEGPNAAPIIQEGPPEVVPFIQALIATSCDLRRMALGSVIAPFQATAAPAQRCCPNPRKQPGFRDRACWCRRPRPWYFRSYCPKPAGVRQECPGNAEGAAQKVRTGLLGCGTSGYAQTRSNQNGLDYDGPSHHCLTRPRPDRPG